MTNPEVRVPGSDRRVPGFLGQIMTPTGTAAGTCFQISPGVLVTAWHVISDLNANEFQTQVRVEPLGEADRGNGFDATVARTNPDADLAVLTADRSLSESVVGLADSDSIVPFTKVIATGVPKVDDPGRVYEFTDAPGRWAGNLSRDGQPLGQMVNSGVMPGMSGAPVRRMQDGFVVGVVSGRYNSADGWLRDRVWTARIEDLRPLLDGLADPLVTPTTDDNLRTLDYDVRPDGLYCVGVWSPARKLEPRRLITESVPVNGRPRQPYIDRRTLADAVRTRSRHSSGATAYMTGFRIDHRESDETQYCQIRQTVSTYPEVLAIEDLRIRRPGLFDECDKAIERDVRAYLGTAVPSSLAVNLVVLSPEDDELMCVERSAAVDSAVGWWTIGVFETMKQPEPNRPGSPEDLYGLAERGLNEELGLQPRDYKAIQISWVGIYRPILRGHVVAVLKLKISKEEVLARTRAAHSGYEHAAIDWIPLRPALVRAFIQANRTTHPNKVGFTLDVNQRTWIDQARLGILEAWRFRNALDND